MSLIELDNPSPAKRTRKLKLSPRKRIAAFDNGKHPGGRDRLYDPDMCDRAIELGKGGASVAQIAADFRISIDTIYTWIKDIEEFADAIAIARTLSLAHWETIGYDALHKRTFQGNVYQFAMSRRFRDLGYGGNDSPAPVTNNTVNVFGLDMLDALIERRQALVTDTSKP